jgi:outer membrane lipoprotein-sorting protein
MRRAAWLALLVSSLCALTTPSRAEPCASTDACLLRIETAQRRTESLRARFTQTKHMSLLNEPLVATGQFAFKRPDRVLWEIEQPDKATVIINGGQLVIPGLPENERESLAHLPVATALSQIGALFTGDMKALRAAFDATAMQDDKGIQVHLVPHGQTTQGMFSQIELTFADADLTLRAIHLQNRLGDRVDVVLDEVVVNAPVPDSLFAVPTAGPTPGAS